MSSAMTTNNASSSKSASLAVAIYTYKSQWNDFLAKSYVDDNTPPFYTPSLKVLENWKCPATDFNEASEALSVALEIYEAGEAEVVQAMMRAAKGYLEQDAKRREQEDASPALLTILDDVQTTHQAWIATAPEGEDLPDNSPEEDAFCAAEAALIAFPCKNIWDVHQKSAWLLSGRDNQHRTAATVLNGIETVHLIAFLRSLLGLPAEGKV